MNNLSNLVPESNGNSAESDNLWHYVQSMSSETVTQLSKPNSREVLQVMDRTIVETLGTLPPEHFGMTITTNRENLGRLLASAMINGYFLHNVEQRMAFEKSLQVESVDFSTDS